MNNIITICCFGYLHTLITGLLAAPTNVSIEVGMETMTLSWSPPYIIDGIPIVQYTVYIINQTHMETVHTTETHITLEKSCTNTAYQISAWNKVGEGNKATYGNTHADMHEYMGEL